MNLAGSNYLSGLRVQVLVIAGLLASPVAADEAEEFAEAARRLNQMSMAMSQMSYQGNFVYIQGSKLFEAMRITHIVDENGIHERLVAQSGTQRELWRDASGVRWIAKEQSAVIRDPAFKRSYFPDVTPAAIEQAAPYYNVNLGGLEQLAGRNGRKLSILPSDDFRYGYNLWLEEPSGFLLKWELFENSARPLAQLVFTDIRIGREVDASELQVPKQMEQYSMHPSSLPARQEVTRAKPLWSPSKLPPGFKLTTHRRQEKNASEPFQHLVYSDGIATVSVYVERAEEGNSSSGETSRLGTTHAFSRNAEGWQITVVGDVPAVTVEEIGNSVAQNTP